MKKRPKILALAGLDPSGGAGLLADVRSIEANGGEPLGIITANTVQDHRTFYRIKWESPSALKFAITQFRKEHIAAVKIGVVRDCNMLRVLTELATTFWPEAPIIWDPIIKSSSNYSFLEDPENLNSSAIKPLSLVTPNLKEYNVLLPFLSGKESTPLLVKSYSETEKSLKDVLWQSGKVVGEWEKAKWKGKEKRGTGCILSSAIATFLGKGLELNDAIEKAETFMNKAYQSSHSHVVEYFKS